MDSVLIPCTLCSTPFPSTQIPKMTQKQIERKSAVAEDVAIISGPSYEDEQAAKEFQKYLEDGQFCPTCRLAIGSLHSNMSLIRQLTQNVIVARKVIQDGINQSCQAWCTRLQNPNVSGIGQFFLDQGELTVSEEYEEVIPLEHEEATSVITGSGWPPDDEEEPSRLNLENVEEIDSGSSAPMESSAYQDVPMAWTSTSESSTSMIPDAEHTQNVHESGA